VDEVADRGGVGAEVVGCIGCMRDIGAVGRGDGLCRWKDWV